MSRRHHLTWMVLCLVLTAGTRAQQPANTTADPLATELRALVPASGSSMVVDAAGIAKSGRRMISLETTEPLAANRRRLAIVGGLDGDPRSTRLVAAFLKWWMQD